MKKLRFSLPQSVRTRRSSLLIKLRISVAFCLLSLSAFAQRDYASLVNPFIGTGGHGHTYPGASMPFGMMQLSPDTRMADWDGSSGYHYSDSVIYGFSHTHLSGTGIPDYCDVLFMPFVGDVQWNNKDYRSRYSHSSEKASPGYYEVLLDKHNIRAQLTTAYRSGMHQYTFPPGTGEGSILIDLKHRDEVLEAYIEKVSATELRGLRRSKSWAQNQYVYFHIQFDQPISEFAVSQDGNVMNTAFAQALDLKAFVRFHLNASETVRARVGISGVSLDGAKANLENEISHWDFDRVKSDARAAWNGELARIDVQGGSRDEQTIFYTALYHTMLAPNIYTDVDGRYRGTDLRVHRASGFVNYSVFSLWDTYRALHPLMTIINEKRTTDWINTFLAQYKNGGMLPVWELSGNETFCMIGYHSVPVIVDAYRKGIRGFDEKLALEAMKSYAESDRFGLPAYRRYGFISNDKEQESVSKTLEYAYDDWCISQFAKMTGKGDDFENYIQRAQNYKNIFDPATKKMRGKLQGIWHSPFDPREINNFYTEGNSWQYSFAAPQDISGMMKLYGGKEQFTRILNELFTTSSKTTGRDQADVTGLIGQYAHGNEPSHHMAYLFSYAGRPEKTQELVHRICTEFYTNLPDGLIGNEDCGQMSAWYVFSAMGFYPVCPGSSHYALGLPVFDTVTIRHENGKQFVITSKKKNPQSFFVAATTLNNQPYSKLYLQHDAIREGGSFEFSLTDDTSTRSTAEVPVTEINENGIVPVPYFSVPTNKFTTSTSVSIRTIVPGQKIYYSINAPGNTDRVRFMLYQKPFNINKHATVWAYAVDGTKQSAVVEQYFHKLPSGRSITIASKVHPMYTAGGNEALIDSLFGSTNWRTGEWQSYYDTDFEATIDLQKVKPVSYVGIHVLQDVSPWILYPKEVIFYASADGKTYAEIARVSNSADQKMDGAQTKEMGAVVKLSARYIKVKAINGGKLPPWHESAGNASHLFIDEIIVK